MRRKCQLIFQDSILEEHMPFYQKILNWSTANVEVRCENNEEYNYASKLYTNIQNVPVKVFS